MNDLIHLKNEMAKKCEEADEIKASLNGRINQIQEKVSALESEMSSKVKEIENIEKDRQKELEKVSNLGDELAQVKAREKCLEEELETLKQVIKIVTDILYSLTNVSKSFQANSDLEEKVELSTRSLMEEKRALEEKSTFLHFTQEQLNTQVEILEGEKQKLKQDIESLKTRVADLENELVSSTSHKSV
jgi:chromosome segregation ATPase